MAVNVPQSHDSKRRGGQTSGKGNYEQPAQRNVTEALDALDAEQQYRVDQARAYYRETRQRRGQAAEPHRGQE